MKIIYRANDGTDFENEEDCQNYERYLDKIRKEIHLYNENFKELSFDDVGWEERICFFKCETEESFNFFVKIFPYDIMYKDFEKLDLFFAELGSDLFMTVKGREKLLSDNYYKAKEFQEKFDKGE